MNTMRLQFARPVQQVRQLSAAEAAVDTATEKASPGFSGEDIQQMFGGLAMAISELDSNQRQSIDELQQVAIELAVAAAQCLTAAVIDRGLFRVDQLVADLVGQLQTEEPVTLYLHPDDLELLHELNNEHAASATDLSQFRLVAEAALARGSCTASSGGISLVSDLESRLTSFRQVWMENLDDAQTERRAADGSGWQPGRVPDRRETA